MGLTFTLSPVDRMLACADRVALSTGNAINSWKAAGEVNAFASKLDDGFASRESMKAFVDGDLKKTRGIVNIREALPTAEIALC